MTINLLTKVKYQIKYTNEFKRNYKKIKKQGKDTEKLKHIVNRLANDLELHEKYKDHMLNDSKNYKNCRECHIEPDWLLVYQYVNNQLILILVATGSHSDLF